MNDVTMSLTNKDKRVVPLGMSVATKEPLGILQVGKRSRTLPLILILPLAEFRLQPTLCSSRRPPRLQLP